MLDTTATVETPERIWFHHRVAGPGPRAVAWAIDGAIRALTIAFLVFVLALFSGLPGIGEAGLGLLLLALFLLDWGYGAVFETFWEGKTPGKWLIGIRVVRVDGSPAKWPQYVLRNLLRAADFLPVGFGLGVIVMAMNEQQRRIGDLVAGTLVVDEDPTRMLSELVLTPPITEEERRALPAHIDLPNDTLIAIEDFLRRRPKLSEARAEELAALCGPQIADRYQIEANTWTRTLLLAYAKSTGRDRPEGS